jgi:hypothetical protein
MKMTPRKKQEGAQRAEREAMKRHGVDLDAYRTGRMREREEQLEKLARGNPCHRRKGKNPGDGDELAAAAALSEQFHGRPAHTVREVSDEVAERTQLADLGRMLVLLVQDDNGRFRLPFRSGVRLASSPDGGQLYFVGGDQVIDPAQLGLEAALPKDHLVLGEVVEIGYHTSKAFHNFEPIDYHHTFGEKSGIRPVLNYDNLSHQLYLSGGAYQVRPEGIVN